MTEPEPHRVAITPATTTVAVNEAVASSGRADLLLVADGAAASPEAVARLRQLAAGDAVVATVSAAPGTAAPAPDGRGLLAPTLARAGGPAILVRRAALDLAGLLDASLRLDEALAAFCEACTARGAVHLLAQDVVVSGGTGTPPMPAEAAPWDPATRALRAAGGARARPTVTLDVRALGGSYVAGTQVHALELARALARADGVHVRLLLPPDVEPAAIAAMNGLEEIETVEYSEVAAGRVPPSDLVHRPQQVYTPHDFRLLQLAGRQIVVTHQDSILYRNPAYFADAEAWESYRRTTRIALAGADAVIFFSAYARDDALRDELLPPKRAVVVAPGVDHDLGEVSPAAQPPALAGVPMAGSLLFLGTNLRHKNRPFVLRLAAALRDRHGWDGHVIFAGPPAERGTSADEETALLATDADLAARVHELGPVSPPHRGWLLRHAGAVAYPSTVEGFGLVPFEAAAAGTPCLVAPQGSLAELLGSQASLVPWDPTASADRAVALLRDERTRRRNVEAIAAEARRHTWAGCADALVDVYQRCLRTPTPAAALVTADALGAEEALRHAQSEVTRLMTELVDLGAQLGPRTLELAGAGGVLPEEVQASLLRLTRNPRLRDAVFAALRTSHRALGS